MACNGHTNSCPSHGGYIGPNEQWSWTDYPYTGVRIKALHIQELKAAINDEATRRSHTMQNIVPNVATGQRVQNETYKTARDAIGEFVGPIGNLESKKLDDASLEDGDLAEDIAMSSLVAALDYRRNLCVCDCNYACTCDCAHSCTCNCNHSCTCNCNHSCTCNCAYSDERLKTDIEEL